MSDGEGENSPSQVTVPSLFISHGAPTLALNPGSAGHAMTQLGEVYRSQFPTLQGVIVMSPHWVTHTLSVQSHYTAPILHDFGGFPEALYRLDYSAPGSPDLADRIMEALSRSGRRVAKDSTRGLDHGAWVPLRYLFPDARLPVLQVSMPDSVHPEEAFRIGEALRPISESGYLIIGSGGLTHNLGHYRGQSDDAKPLPYVQPFAEWFHAHLMSWNFDALFQYRRLAPYAQEAHPTDDHLMPLFFALGAAPSTNATRLHASVSHALLAMDLYAFGDWQGEPPSP